jgi:hypothetical protein
LHTALRLTEVIMTESIRPDPLRQVDPQDEKAAAEARRLAELNRRERDNERATPVDAGDVSPHYGGRAQPGDVLGIETGGETTGIGDTAEDEDERRRDATKRATRDRD